MKICFPVLPSFTTTFIGGASVSIGCFDDKPPEVCNCEDGRIATPDTIILFVEYETSEKVLIKASIFDLTQCTVSASPPLDEDVGGKQMYLWRAVDGEGVVLDVLVQKRRSKQAALRLVLKLLKNQSVRPTQIVTDKLKSYGIALRDLALGHLHETENRLNNRVESSHVPIRRRERKVQRFKSQKSAQRFLSTYGPVYNLFNVQRHLISRPTLRTFPDQATEEWNIVTAAI